MEHKAVPRKLYIVQYTMTCTRDHIAKQDTDSQLSVYQITATVPHLNYDQNPIN